MALAIWESLTAPARAELALPPWSPAGRVIEWAQMIREAEQADALDSISELGKLPPPDFSKTD